MQKVNDQIVDDATRLIEHAAIQRLARHLQASDIVGQQVLQICFRIAAADVDHGHVRDIEHAGIGTHRLVLGYL